MPFGGLDFKCDQHFENNKRIKKEKDVIILLPNV